MAGSFYVTTPIYYVNDVPHLGHAYTSLAADTMARWHRMRGDDVYFLTGTDEHGKKIETAAQAAGVETLAHADANSAQFLAMGQHLGLTNDDFIRTTQPRHAAVVHEMWRRMRANGDIYLGHYEGWYSVGDEAYFNEDEIVDGKAPSGHEVSWVVEPSYFFRLSKYGPVLLEHMRAHPEFVRPETRYNEILRFVEGGLQDISISRTTFGWGVSVPDDPDHVMYVWLDALTNYISALGGPDGELFGRYWPRVIHLIGKDILRFHAVYWPCFLLSAGLEMPHQVFAHGWWTIEGQKMSKTLGNTVRPKAVIDEYGVDAFRYFLLREVTFGSDGDYSERALRNRINGDLANDFGNLLNRTLNMVHRYHGGAVPGRGERGELDDELLAKFETARADLERAMETLSFNRALAAIWELVRFGNKYVDSSAPWALVREGKTERLHEVLYNVCETLRIVGIWTLPFLPNKSAELLDRLGISPDARTLAAASEWGGLPSGGATHIGDPLFPRLEVIESASKKSPKNQPRAESKKKKSKADPTVDESADGLIQYGDFAKLELRVARITAAKKHTDAERLLELTVDAGDPEPRTVCAGIAEAYQPEALVGRTVALLANLAPRKIRGVVSEGMLLAAGEGKDIQLVTLSGDLPPGTRIS